MLVLVAMAGLSRASWVWVEGEKRERSTMHRHPYWYDQVKRDKLALKQAKAGGFSPNSRDR